MKQSVIEFINPACDQIYYDVVSSCERTVYAITDDKINRTILNQLVWESIFDIICDRLDEYF